MSRYNLGQNRPGRVEKVERIELSGEHLRLRLVLVCLLAGFGILAIMYGIMQLLSANEGWNQITADSTYGLGCGSEFILEYNLGESGMNATAEKKAVRMIYSEDCVYMYHLFSSDDLSENPVDYLTVYDINQRPNEVLTIEEPLYKAFEMVQEQENRYLYLAPVYTYYQNLFYCQSPEDTVEFDPYRNEEIANFYAEVAAFAADPAAVDLELLGKNQIRLHVSDAYLKFAEEEGITDFIDFDWMKNAFVIDYLADHLIEQGYTYGTLSSFDGYTRVLDPDETHSYSGNLFDLYQGTVYTAGKLQIIGQTATCYLRTYPMSTADKWRYYEMPDGEIRHTYISLASGLPQTGDVNLYTWTKESGCAKLLLSVMSSFIDGTPAEYEKFHAQGIDSVHFEKDVMIVSDPKAQITDLCQEPVSFTLKFAE